jgi:hypothetical protein
MSDSDSAGRSSGSPQRISFKSAEGFGYKTQDIVYLLPSFALGTSLFNMPNADRIRYSNKESVKVNAGIDIGHWMTDVESAFSTSKPVVNIRFCQFMVPVVAPEAKPTTEALVRRLLNPPPHAFVHGTISIHWVIAAVGREHIQFRNSDERYVLAQDSTLRKQGIVLGIPALYMEWLCGNDEEVSAAELGVYLTLEFFDEVKS